jgi:mannitol-1-phosphate/altronate dehydrogenase
MDTTRILENAERDEARRAILREAIDRFNNELLPDDERQVLLDRIKKLRIRLALA